MQIDFRGAGGSSGGSSFSTAPDTLRSNDTFEGLLGLCVGPIKGPVDGMKSVRINQTPIEDTTGTDNFKNFAANFADGDPLKFPQVVTLRLGAAGAPDNINTQLRNIGGTNPQWSTHTLNPTGASHIDLRFIVNELYRQDKNGVYATTANILIEMKPVGTATWINPFDSNGNTLPSYDPTGYSYSSADGAGDISLLMSQESYGRVGASSTLTISGKTTSTYVKELRINVPNSGNYANVGWDIRCQLVENEDLEADPSFEKRNITWESATAVFANTMGSDEEWRAFSWLQLYGKASDSFSGVPDVSGVYDTKIVSVPPSTVYNPDTRQYTGAIWDGSWAKAFTSDPAWIINDAITDSISGIARLVPGAYLNKWDALELSKYCSELVSDGSGGQQPRWSLNLAIDQPQRSDDFIRYLAGAAGATAWDNGDGEWRLALDKPQNPVALYTLENLEGEFNYSHTDIDTRFNEVTVTFLNEEFDYRQDQLKIKDDDHIGRFGRKPTSVVAIGCTNRQQALRWAILKMRTNINEFRNVSFTTNRQGKMLERFRWILIADGSLNMTLDDTKRTTGRVVQNTGGSIVLRDTVRLEVGLAYQIKFTAPNPNYNPDSATAPTDPDWQAPTLAYTRNVTNSAAQVGDVKELFIDSPLPANVAPNVNVALDCPNLPSVPKVYRVIDLSYNDDGERVTVNAIEVDTGKYPASDAADYPFEMPGYNGAGNLVPSPVAPAAGVLALQNNVTPTTLVASWQRPPNFGHVKNFHVERRWNDGPWIQVGDTVGLTAEVANPQPGNHEFRIYTVDNFNRQSLPLDASLSITPDQLPSAASMVLIGDGATFDFMDGVPFNTTQLITLSAENISEALDWSTNPAVTLGTTADPFQRTLSLANFGANQNVTVTVKGKTSGYSASVTLVRNDQTTPDDSIIPDSTWTATVIANPTPVVNPGDMTDPNLTDTPWRTSGGLRFQLMNEGY